MTGMRGARPYDRIRLACVVGLFGLGFLGILVRLCVVQVAGHAYWRTAATQQHTHHTTLQPERGRVLDRHGRVLATSVPVPSVYAVPRDITQPELMAIPLAEVLDLPRDTIRPRLNSPASFVWLARHVTPQTVAQLRKLQLAGVYFVTEPRRYYPKHHLAGQLLGFVGIDGQGLGGLEYRYNQKLTAAPRRVRLQRDAKGRHMRLAAEDTPEPPRGADLYVTLDERLQHVAEREIATQAKDLSARSGLVVIMQPHSGDILAMAAYPFFNPNAFQDARQRVWQRNPGVTDLIEPGSTFKAILAAAVLEEQIIHPREQFFCENGLVQRGRRRLRDYKPHGYLSFADVFAYSSNIGAVKIAERLTSDQFYDYIQRFGFGARTRIDLPGEHHGRVRPPPQWSGFSHDSLALGQEIAVTPIQLTRAFAAIANGGWLVRPRVVARMAHRHGSQTVVPHERRRILSRQTTDQLTAILTGVVAHGTGQSAAVEGYAVAGKTGTAQKVDPDTRRYSHTKVLTSFVGYVPAADPQIVVLVMLDEPQRQRWGSQAAAPVFRRVAEQSLHYLQVPPSREPIMPLPVTRPRKVVQQRHAHRAAPSLASDVVSVLGTH